MDNITQGFSNLTTTMSAGAKRFDEPVGDVGVPTDFAGNKLDPTGFAIDNFLRGIFSWVPGVLPVAKGTIIDPMTHMPPIVGPGTRAGMPKRLDPMRRRRAARTRTPKSELFDDLRITEMQDKTKLGQS